jgi:hypothetical protein
MAEDNPVQLDYGKSKPPQRSPWRFVRSVLVLCTALALTLMILRTPIVGGWIGKLVPVTSLVLIGALLILHIWSFLRGDSDVEEGSSTGPKDSVDATYAHSCPAGGSLGIGASTFSGAQVGCAGAAFLIIFTVLCVFGLLAMVWWPYIRGLSHQ